MTAGGTWADVARHAEERMDELGMTRAELERQSGVSDATLRKVLDQHLPLTRRDKIVGLCTGLRWSGDSIARILRGGDPVATGASASETEERLDAMQRRLDRFEGLLAARGLLDQEPA